MLPDVSILDYFLAFLYLLLIFMLSFVYSSYRKSGDKMYKNFMKALSAKMFGGLGFFFLTIYYWKGGDTLTYYHAGSGLSDLFITDFTKALKVIFSSHSSLIWENYDFADGHHNFLGTEATFTTIKLTAIVNLFSFNSYLVCTILFSYLSFLGVWNMYIVFSKLYSALSNKILLAMFFIPSVILWGSGILKDTITMACVGWIVYSFANLLLLKRKKIASIILLGLSIFFIALIKPYILYVLMPSLFIWVQGNLDKLIKARVIRKLISPLVAIIMVLSSIAVSQKISESAGKYDLETMGDTLEGFQSWHTTVSEQKNQSGYTLGEMEFTPLGLLKKFPEAIMVTFFRPYLWEITNASTLLGAIEGLALTVIVVWLVLKYRGKLFKLIYKNKDVLFLLVFALVFGAICGISSYNFGALSRYKMPAQVFFVLALILITSRISNNNKEKVK